MQTAFDYGEDVALLSRHNAGLRVELVYVGGRLSIVVWDGDESEPRAVEVTPDTARDAFDHPFCYLPVEDPAGADEALTHEHESDTAPADEHEAMEALIFTRQDWPHGLRCMECNGRMQDGMHYSKKLVGVERAESEYEAAWPVSEIVCMPCGLGLA